MNTNTESTDPYEIYEELFDPTQVDRQARRKRRTKAKYKPKMEEEEILTKTAQTIGLEGGLQISYRPSRHEEGWLEDSLRDFFTQELISDVQALVKGGKEANVYRCAAHPATGKTWLAAKVYRPRIFRNLRNDKRYRDGRPTLTADGNPAKATDHRLMRALGKKSAFGQQVAHTSWLMYEFTTLNMLHEAGADVPQPYAASNNAILMDYVGDERGAAPALNELKLPPQEAFDLLQTVLDNVALMLQYGRVHGDLSAYNILYWEGAVTLIDFPQVINSHVSRTTHAYGNRVNPDAYEILQRDINRVCEYFAGQGVQSDPANILEEYWRYFVQNDDDNRLADASVWLET